MILTEGATAPFWATLENCDAVGRYVKLQVECADKWTLLNEVQVYGVSHSQVANNNIALEKVYTVAGYADSPYTASLTDGIASQIFQQGLNNSSWFAFSDTGDTQTGNVNDNKGIVTIDLGGQAEITGTSINLFAGANDAGSGAANIYDRGPSGANIKPVNSYSWTKTNVPAGQTWVAKAYVQYKTQEGKLITVYSDLVEAIKE